MAAMVAVVVVVIGEKIIVVEVVDVNYLMEED